MPRPLRPIFAGLPREVPILASVTFTVALGYGIVAPCIPEFARQFGVSTAAAASVISAFALVRIVGALPAGRLVDRLGERQTMIIGLLIVSVSSVVAGFSGSFAELLVLRGLGGLGSAMFGVSGQTLLLRSVPGELRGRASGLYSGGFLLGGISGPAIGGLVAAWSLRAPFFIYGAMLLAPTAIAVLVLRSAPRRQPGSQRQPAMSFRQVAAVLRNRAYLAAASANTADGFAVLGVRTAIVPLFVHEVLHRSALWTGIGFGVVAVLNAVTLLPAGRMADTLGRRPVLVAGCAVGCAGMILLTVLPGLWGFLAAMAVLGIGSGFLDVAPSAMIGDIIGRQAGPGTGPGQGGTLIASYQMAGDLGTVTGPVAVGFLVDSVSYGAAFVAAACVLGLAALAGLAAPETAAASPPHFAGEDSPQPAQIG